MRTRVVFCIGTMLIFLLTIHSGCGSARRGEPLTEPIRVASDREKSGEQVFMGFCHECHPGGEGGLGPALNNKLLPGFMIRLQVRRGFGAMPSFSQEEIPNGKLDDLIAYLRTLRRQG
jgi:mono/diheme cytochrome c family protein